MPANRWIDVSVPLATGMVHWPGDPEPSFERISAIEQGAEANVTLCRMTAHTGTHMDAPNHFLAGERGIDEFPLEVGIGRARVIAMTEDVRTISKATLQQKGIRRGERILFKTRNSAVRWDNRDFQPDYTALDESGAAFLQWAGVVLVGVDYLSIGLHNADGPETHRTLLRAGIWIVEGLNLASIPDGDYDMVCLPLRIQSCDGSPARVALRPV
ncbi:MAG TPA: cyclase family protein [Bryobacteraceae bacterium]|jgi:arylformamidase|nr:cyclase family protein [Bryobacteraceae bacterium]